MSDLSDPLPYIIAIVVLSLIVVCLSIKIFINSRQKKATGEEFEEEIISMVNESHKQGVLMSQEARMIHNIFEFDDKDAKDIMVHRGDITAIDGDEKLIKAIEMFKESHYSRFPVYLGDMDNIIGIIHMRELLEYSLDKQNFHKKIRDIDGIMAKPLIFHETMSINALLTKMQQKKTHLVMIRDEYGQISGLVTLEDILEEIVGNIQDEHDKESPSIIERGKDFYFMFGKTPLEDAAMQLGIDFSTQDFETLNGFLTNELGRIPAEGEQFEVEFKGFSFRVENVKENIIQAVRVERILEDRAEK